MPDEQTWAADKYLDKQPDLAGSYGYGGYGPDHVLVVRFTGDIPRHRAELRRLYPGLLCVEPGRYSTRQLGETGWQLWDDPVLKGSLMRSGQPAANEVDAMVVVADPATLRHVADRWGDMVHVTGWFHPVG